MLETAPIFYKDKNIEIYSRKRVGHFSLFGSSKNPYISINYALARELDKEKFEDLKKILGNSTESALDFTNGYVHHENMYNRIEPILTWILRKHVLKADIVTDRTSLTKIAVTPYEEGGFGWVFQCRRIGRTIMVNPYKLLEEDEFYNTPHQKEHLYTREKLRDAITKPYKTYSNFKDLDHIDSSNHYYQVHSIDLADANGQGRIPILFASQFDIWHPTISQEKDNFPIEIRCHTGELGTGKHWYAKTLKWAFQFEFSGADKVIIGRKARNEVKVTKVVEVPTKVFAMGAEDSAIWRKDVGLAFLYEVMREIRIRMANLSEEDALIVSHRPDDFKVTFEVAPDNEPSFIPEEFTRVFKVEI